MTTYRGDEPHHAGQRGWRRLAEPAFARFPPAARRSILHAFGKYAPWEAGFDLTPPQPGPFEVTGPPDFVGIGVQKAGTTWWFDAICAHPDVFSRDDIHKERHFFDRYVVHPFRSQDRALYHEWFPRPAGALTGEWTPDYMHYPWVPVLLAEAAPRAHLLALVRDPVERFRSGVAHHRRDRGRLSSESYRDAVARGFYLQGLRPWTSYFAPEQVLVLQYEQCRADPAGELARTYRFLGLRPYVHEEIEKRVNVTDHVPELDEEVRRRLVRMYEPEVRALVEHFPNIDLGLWPNFAGIGGE